MISSLPPQKTIPPDWELLEGGLDDMRIRLTHGSLEDMGWVILKGEGVKRDKTAGKPPSAPRISGDALTLADAISVMDTLQRMANKLSWNVHSLPVIWQWVDAARSRLGDLAVDIPADRSEREWLLLRNAVRSRLAALRRLLPRVRLRKNRKP